MIETWGMRALRWVLALSVTGSVHGAFVAYALHTPPVSQEESQTGGAFLVELAPITASPTEEREDIAVGRASEERAAVAASAPQRQAVEQRPEPVPDAPPVPETHEPPPEDAVARKEPEEKPPEEPKPEVTPTVQKVDAPAVAPVEASVAAAPPKIENATEKATVTRGQNIGLSRKDRRAIQNWRRDLVVHLARHKRYPAAARSRRAQGVVEIAFEIDETGLVRLAKVKASSGSDLLDAAALAMVQQASPVPAPPAGVGRDGLAFTIPVQFKLRN